MGTRYVVSVNKLLCDKEFFVLIILEKKNLYFCIYNLNTL